MSLESSDQVLSPRSPAPRRWPRPWSGEPPRGKGYRNGSHELVPLVDDPDLLHFARFLVLGVGVCVLATFYLGVALIPVYAHLLSVTGRRKRDVFLVMIPISGHVMAVQTIWRYTSKNIYWSVREDRPSKSLFAR